MPDEPLETVDVRNNPESRAAASNTSSSASRANDGGAQPREAPESGELPETVEHGTAAGSPVSGVTISDQDAAAAVRPEGGS
jgi:hypothetical protein